MSPANYPSCRALHRWIEASSIDEVAELVGMCATSLRSHVEGHPPDRLARRSYAAELGIDPHGFPPSRRAGRPGPRR